MLQSILSISAIALAIIYSVFNIFRKENRIANYALFSGLLFTSLLEAFDQFAIIYPDSFLFWKQLSLYSESLLPAALLIFSLTFARKGDLKSVSLLQQFFLLISPVFLITATSTSIEEIFYSPDFDAEKILFLGNIGFAFYLGILIYMIISLVNFEITFLTASKTDRWKIKFEIIGAGVLIAMFIFYYSDGLLYRTINMNLLPVKSIFIITAVIFMAYSKLMRGNGVKVYISKEMAYRSVVIFIVGAYLIGLGLAGQGMRYFGESSHNIILFSIAFIGGIGLIIVLFSETIKRKIKVFLYKNFYTHKYDYRTEWLKFTEKLTTSKTGDDILKAILSGYCETFGMGGGSLFLYDAERGLYYNKALFEMKTIDKVFNKDNTIIKHIKTKRVFNINDDKPEVIEENREFLQKNGISFIIPLYSDEDIEGFIALGRPVNKNEIYTYEDYDLMKTLARQAYSVILNLKLSDELSKAREMEVIGRVSAFVIHDLKNLVSGLSLIVDNAKDYIDEPDFQNDMLMSLSGTVGKMKGLMSRLKNLKEKELLNLETADLYRIVNDTVKTITIGNISMNGNSVFSKVDSDEIQKVVLNLILNAIEAVNGNGKVMVEVGKDDMAFIKIRDSGCGMSEEFQQKHLFKPFSTTKSKGLGIGLYQCKQIIEAHDGRIEVSSEVGKGSVFTVYLPVMKEQTNN